MMRKAGVDIQSHSVSHSNLKDKSGKWQALQPNYEAWLRQEMVGSKLKLERNLGISVKAFAYPYGNHNAEVRRIAMESGYEAAFTVYGQRLAHRSAPDQLGRYAIESLHPKIFEDALKMSGGGVGGGESGGAYVVAPAASSMMARRSVGLAAISWPTWPWLTRAVEREPVAASANSNCTSRARVSEPLMR